VRAKKWPQYILGRSARQIIHWRDRTRVRGTDGALSHSCSHQPESNGAVEGFFRTLMEQVVYGRIFHRRRSEMRR
jgi:putative transposase